MPINKIGDVYRDIQSYPFVNGAHVYRVSAAVNTLESSETKAIIIPDATYALIRQTGMAYKTPELPATFETLGNLAIQMPYTMGEYKATLLILTVYNKDTGELECYPFSNANKDGKFWPYDVRFFVVQPSSELPTFRKGNFNPLAAGESLDEMATRHMISLGSIVMATVKGIVSGKITLLKDDEDYAKLNKARSNKGLSALRPDYMAIPSTISGKYENVNTNTNSRVIIEEPKNVSPAITSAELGGARKAPSESGEDTIAIAAALLVGGDGGEGVNTPSRVSVSVPVQDSTPVYTPTDSYSPSSCDSSYSSSSSSSDMGSSCSF